MTVSKAAEKSSEKQADATKGRKDAADGLPEALQLGELSEQLGYVLKRAQGSGLGRRLLVSTARALAARGATSLVIWVLRDNASARRFYERMGGASDRERDEAIGGGLVVSVAYRWSDIQTLFS